MCQRRNSTWCRGIQRANALHTCAGRQWHQSSGPVWYSLRLTPSVHGHWSDTAGQLPPNLVASKACQAIAAALSQAVCQCMPSRGRRVIILVWGSPLLACQQGLDVTPQVDRQQPVPLLCTTSLVCAATLDDQPLLLGCFPETLLVCWAEPLLKSHESSCSRLLWSQLVVSSTLAGRMSSRSEGACQEISIRRDDRLFDIGVTLNWLPQ